jgi:hypothetical protein
MVKYSFSVRLSCAYTNMSGGEGGLLIQLIKVFIWCNKCQSWPKILLRIPVYWLHCCSGNTRLFVTVELLIDVGNILMQYRYSLNSQFILSWK